MLAIPPNGCRVLRRPARFLDSSAHAHCDSRFRRRNWWPAFIIGLALWGASFPAFAQQPMDALRQQITAGIRILNDPQYRQGAHRSRQLQKLREVTRRIFDFKEFSRRVLASRWKKFTPLQQKEFVAVFGTFLEKFYLARLQGRYHGEQVVYLEQQMIGHAKALVDIKVLWHNLEVPVTLRMTRRGGSWKAYDISVLGISAVRNYRAQFKVILHSESPSQVIARLKRKLAALDSKLP